MTDILPALESLQLDFARAAHEQSALTYWFVECANEAPSSVWEDDLGHPVECMETFRYGDQWCAHCLDGSRDALQEFRRLSEATLGFVPLRFQHSLLTQTNRD